MEVQAKLAVAIVLSFIALSYGAEVGAPFGDFFETSSDNNHFQMVNGGKEVNLILDRSSASGFASKGKYLYGYVGMQLKLVAGDSAGTVTAYYLASGGSAHDEIDFEFLGNVSGEPYILQSNIYAAGVGNREVRHYLWFDPTTDFHTYSVVWNKQQIVFYVDSKPIRVFKNNQNLGVPYLTSQPMGVYSSLWNADDWATRGGQVKTDWSHAPFVASYRNFNIQACSSSGCPANTWWDKAEHYSLSAAERDQLNWVNKNYMIYNYCTDTARFAQKPPECS